MWFSVVYSFIDRDTRHHSGLNVVDSRGAVSKYVLPHPLLYKIENFIFIF